MKWKKATVKAEGLCNTSVPMPFTFAHPALIIPLKKIRGGLSLTALAVGSMVPDFENFFNMQETEVTSHQLSGFFLFDLPVGLFACFLFHNLLKHGFVENLPRFYQRRFSHLVSLTGIPMPPKTRSL
ncbi:MAG: DUF4184 family protein [Chitinophagaceae bacterium]|nr:DUF4184 family protein [Chitinophagaceae bacterium]